MQETQAVDAAAARGPDLALVCRAALTSTAAAQVTVWRCQLGGRIISPYVRVSAPAHGRARVAPPERDVAIGAVPKVGLGALPALAAGLATGGPFVLHDVAALGLPAAAPTAHCQVVPGCSANGQPAGFVTIEPATDPDGSTEPGAPRPDPVTVATLTVLTAAVAAWWGPGGDGPTGATDALIRDLDGAGADLEPVAFLRLACRRLACAVGARRASIYSEEEPGLVWLRQSLLPDGTEDPAAWAGDAAHHCPPLVERVLSSGRPEVTTYDTAGPRPNRATALGATRPGTTPGDRRTHALGAASALAVPLGERAVLVLDGDRPCAFGAAEVDLALAVAAHLRETTTAVRRGRQGQEHEVTASALRQLLEAGVRACSPMEAAEALAAAAIKVVGVPTACAYLVGADGMISEVATVGATPARAEALRTSLIGQPAAGSPVWRRTVEGEEAGPDLVSDTAVAGLVRPGGVAEVLGLRSLATIPLLSSDGPLGLVLCGGPEPRRQWRARDREMLAQLALEGAVVVDNARLREAERHEASHDPLTGLLNRRAFADQFRHALATPRRSEHPLAVMVLDLDRFKEVNDHLGHHCGDELLVQVGERLRSVCRKGDVLGRLGGDEFAMVVGCDNGPSDATAIAARIRAALDVPVTLGDTALQIDVSIGVAFAPDHGAGVPDLLRRADLAMYSAKRSGQGTQVYRPEMRSTTGELGLLADLRTALRRGDELVLHYQPKVDLADGRVTGVEALVRWDHPVHGLLGPDCFVPMAEGCGLVGALTAWVVPTALRQLAEWRAQGHDLRLAVNVSPRDVADPELVTSVGSWLAEAGVPGTSLVVEVTEGALLQDLAQTTAALAALRELGVEVSLDDFGTGYSSLAYLESLPIDEIKADRQFLRFETGEGWVLRSIIALGHAVGVRVVAEGVETVADLEWLRGAGCDEAQGYHFSRPVEAAAIVALLADPAVPASL